MALKLTIDQYSGEFRLEKTTDDNRIKMSEVSLAYKCRIVKHFIVAFIQELNGNNFDLVDNREETTNPITTKDVTLFDFWKRVSKIEYGYYNKYIEPLGEKIEKDRYVDPEKVYIVTKKENEGGDNN